MGFFGRELLFLLKLLPVLCMYVVVATPTKGINKDKIYRNEESDKISTGGRECEDVDRVLVREIHVASENDQRLGLLHRKTYDYETKDFRPYLDYSGNQMGPGYLFGNRVLVWEPGTCLGTGSLQGRKEGSVLQRVKS